MAKENPTHTKSQFVASKKYRKYRDIVAVALKDGRLYTAAEVDEIIDAFLKRQVEKEI